MTDTAAAGSPVWIDYTATDFARQKDFYQSVFGWEFADQGPDYGHYQMITKDGAHVGGAMDGDQLAAATGQPAPPAGWCVYLRSDDLDATMAAVAEHGGTVHVEPMAVGDLGRMAIVQSPAGEVVGFWEPGSFGGHDLPLAVGTSVWFEVMSMDFERSAAFYRAVAGWDVVPMGGPEDADGQDGDGPGYATNFAMEHATAGLCDASVWFPAGTPGFWRMYQRVTDVDQACELITTLGGQVLDGPIDSPFGRVATVTDPAGATFQINQTPPEG